MSDEPGPDELRSRVWRGMRELARMGQPVDDVQIVIHPAMWRRLCETSTPAWPADVWHATFGGLPVITDNYIGVREVRLRIEVTV